jgi:hypothetical protein
MPIGGGPLTDPRHRQSPPDYFEGILAEELCKNDGPMRGMMRTVEDPVHPTLEALAGAVATWVEKRDGRKLSRWLNRELGADGVPVRLDVMGWRRCLGLLAEARRDAGGWPPGCEERIAGLVLMGLRFARPDGSPAMQLGGAGRDVPDWVPADWADWYRGTDLGRVLHWWFGAKSRRNETAPPPLPTWSAADRVLAVLRPDWTTTGDFLALDHRGAGSPCRFELFGNGRTWLGPEWGEGVSGPASRPRPSRRLHGGAADLIEWTYRVGQVRVTRSALLLRGRRLALFSVLVEAPEPDPGIQPTLRLAMPPTVAAGPLPGSRALVLAESGRRGAAQAVPIALPCRPYPTDRGSLQAHDGVLALRQAPAGRRCWLPLLVSWDADRHRKTLEWRVLTITERYRPVPADRAFAARVSWGRNETYVIYRSLGPPARRTFLGHQTAARLLVADFTEDGDLKPILTVE